MKLVGHLTTTACSGSFINSPLGLMFDPIELAEVLLAARRPGQRLESMPESGAPSTIPEAYSVQDCLVHLLSKEFGPTVGYKVGCTNQGAREMLNVESPFYGHCFTEEIHRSPATIRGDTLHMIGVEPEIAIRIGDDIPTAQLWTAKRVVNFVGEIMPAIEIVESRFSGWPRMGIHAAISDNGVHRKLILGESILDWQETLISGAKVELSADQEIVRTGNAHNVDGGPFGVLAWLANEFNNRGLQLKSGDVVTTGVMTDIYDAYPSQRLVAEYKNLGTVELNIS